MSDQPSPAVLEARSNLAALRNKISRLGGNELDLLFRVARTHNAWQNKPVSDELLRELVSLVQLSPTSANCQPARIVFVRSPEGKAKLVEAVSPGNAPKVKAAPVTAIIGYDVRFFENLKRTFPHRDVSGQFRDNPAVAERGAFQNGTLQVAYFILAARALGLDTGPMTGFDTAKVDAAFLAGTSVKSNVLVNVGYGDESGVMQRLPRLEFEEVCRFA